MRRAIVRITLCLIAGAIVNVAVAWAVAWWAEEFDLVQVAEAGVATAFDDQGLVTESWWVDRREGFGSTVFISGRFLYRPRPHSDYDGLEHPSNLLPRWVDFDRPSLEFVSRQADGDDRFAELRGWPWRALGCTFYYDRQANQFRSFRAIDVGSSSARSGEPRLLPLRPLWPGFAINTLFYAAILGLLFAVPARVRRTLRRRRGLCPKCAYPIGESSVCTECGAAVDARPQP